MKKGLIIAVLAVTMAGSALGAALEETTTLKLFKFMSTEEGPREVTLTIARDASWASMLEALAHKAGTTKEQLVIMVTDKTAKAATMNPFTLDKQTYEWEEIKRNPTRFSLTFRIMPLKHVIAGKAAAHEKRRLEAEEAASTGPALAAKLNDLAAILKALGGADPEQRRQLQSIATQIVEIADKVKDKR